MKVLQVLPDSPEERLFLKLPSLVYAQDPCYIPLTEASVIAELKRGESKQGQAVFVVENDGEPLSRCMARCSLDTNTTGRIGLFESLNDMKSCSLLLCEAEKWLASQGCRRVLGPLDGDTWHRYRFAAGPWDVEPFLKEPWNPSFYPGLWESCGYIPADRYYSSLIKDPAAAAANLAPFLKRVARLGYQFRPIRKDNIESELALLHRLSTEIFSENPHYSPIDLDDFLELYADAGSLIIPQLCQFCTAPDGSDIGFVFCFPDYARAVRAMKGSRSLLAKIRFVIGRRSTSRVCIKSLGCLPRYRGTGAGPALMGLAFQQTVACGFKEALMCLMHESNDSRRLDGGTSTVFRNYVLYGKGLD